MRHHGSDQSLNHSRNEFQIQGKVGFEKVGSSTSTWDLNQRAYSGTWATQTPENGIPEQLCTDLRSTRSWKEGYRKPRYSLLAKSETGFMLANFMSASNVQICVHFSKTLGSSFPETAASSRQSCPPQLGEVFDEKASSRQAYKTSLDVWLTLTTIVS